MKNKVCLVTGANAGIGKATAMGLAAQGAIVEMLCRDVEKGETAVREVQKATGNRRVNLLLCDLSSLVSIRQAVTEFKNRHEQLQVLINNAAIIPPTRQLSEDGFELQFAVNHLACFLLTNLLLDVIQAGAPARIVNVSSQVHASGRVDFTDLQSEKSYEPSQVYCHTKLMNVLFTYELARRLGADTAVTVNCLHPGVVNTNLLKDYMGTPRAARTSMGVSTEAGAKTSLYVATAPELVGVTGKYFRDGQIATSSAASHDQVVAQQLWQVSAALVGLN